MSKMRYIILGLSVGSLALGAGCQYEEPDPFTAPLKVVGGTLDPDQLNRGREAYVLHCFACHGMEGDGYGPAAYALRPAPRDLRKGIFKFTGTQNGVPTDEAMKRIILGGLKGTAMLPWDVPESQVDDIIAYIKSISVCDESGEFCEGWALNNEGESDNEVTNSIADTMKPDPYGPAKAGEAIKRGEVVYHGGAQCWTCHAAYATKPRIEGFVKAEKGAEAPVPWRDDMYRSKLQKATDYSIPSRVGGACSMTEAIAAEKGEDFECAQGRECMGTVFTAEGEVESEGRCRGIGSCTEDDQCTGEGEICNLGRCEYVAQFLPPDFTYHHVRSGETLADLNRSIAGGVRGTAMAAWKQAGLSDDDIWALSYYVQSLIAKKGTAAAFKEKNGLEAQ